MPIDESFKQPGSIPFKWEIRPGVPKLHNHKPPSNHYPPSLKPPPSSSISASPRTQSSRFNSDKPMIGRPEVVSLGCFQARKLVNQRKTNNKLHAETVYKSDIETLSQWSESTQNSRSPFYNDSSSPRASSFSSSNRSSPWMMASDVEWAGYGLF